jgi:hypothetical protein
VARNTTHGRGEERDVIRRLLTVAPTVLLLAACGAPDQASNAAAPVASATSASATTAATTTPTATPEPAVVPVDGGGAAPLTVVRAAAPAQPLAAAPQAAAAPQPVAAAPVAKPTTTKPTVAKPKPVPAKPAPAVGCNPNYTPCVPNDPVDVDCQGGSGNGPSYVKGPVTVTGTDVYGLDADKDGVGCE